MTKQETIQHLCGLVSGVGWRVFRSAHAHDCVCDGRAEATVAPEVLDFIDRAVMAAIEAEEARRGDAF
jgi:hypothetical protein